MNHPNPSQMCECGHPALDHHGADRRVRRDAGCQTHTMRDDWCRCPKTASEVMIERWEASNA